MKKILIALLVFILAVSSAACSETPKRTDEFLDNFETVTDKDTPSWEFDRADYDLTWFIDAPWMHCRNPASGRGCSVTKNAMPKSRKAI